MWKEEIASTSLQPSRNGSNLVGGRPLFPLGPIVGRTPVRAVSLVLQGGEARGGQGPPGAGGSSATPPLPVWLRFRLPLPLTLDLHHFLHPQGPGLLHLLHTPTHPSTESGASAVQLLAPSPIWVPLETGNL